VGRGWFYLDPGTLINILCAISWYMSTTFFPPVGTDPTSPLSKLSAVLYVALSSRMPRSVSERGKCSELVQLDSCVRE